MGVPYDIFTGAFLSKITEYEFIELEEENRTSIVDDYMKRALAAFRKNCKYDFFTTGDDETRSFDVEVDPSDLDELIDIISEGMLVQWLKPYVYRQEQLENVLNTRDFTAYSPAELLHRVGAAYKKAQDDYKNMIREYSYNHGDLTDLHL
ncbi:MAG: hypothetical protein KBS82_05590 [Oscillospiraceae bacterium]|nr:hypothetical protein [Candidatus Limimonas egerieequi]